jgi:hypothetical protein
MREFCDWADAIPLMAGAVFSEMPGMLTRGDGRKNEWTQKEITPSSPRRTVRRRTRSPPRSKVPVFNHLFAWEPATRRLTTAPSTTGALATLAGAGAAPELLRDFVRTAALVSGHERRLRAVPAYRAPAMKK